MVDGVQLTFARIVGRLLDMNDDSSTFRFLVHDGTGSMQFTHYVEQGEAWSLKRGSLECVGGAAPAHPPTPASPRLPPAPRPPPQRPPPSRPPPPARAPSHPSPQKHAPHPSSSARARARLGKYIDVVFEVKSNAGKDCPPLSFSAVTDGNRVTRHLLEVVYGHLFHTRGALVAPGGGGGGGAGSGASPSGMMAGGGGGVQGGGLGVGGDGGRAAGMGSEINAVLAIYKECEDEDGTSLQDAIYKGKQRGLSEKTVRDATVNLQMDGLIYSTMDESHYRCVLGQPPPSPLASRSHARTHARTHNHTLAAPRRAT